MDIDKKIMELTRQAGDFFNAYQQTLGKIAILKEQKTEKKEKKDGDNKG